MKKVTTTKLLLLPHQPLPEYATMITKKERADGFEYLEINNNSASAKVALQGGHLFHYQQHGKDPLLWLSDKSYLKNGKAIRGGIPICWPWFGKCNTDSSLPQHGFARTARFELIKSHEPDENSTELLLQLESSDQTLTLWPYRFKLLLHITIGKTLIVSLTTKNCDTKSFSITSALHSYFTVSNIDSVYVQGLDQTGYWDALTDETGIQEGNIHISEEFDRVYQKTEEVITLHDTERTIQITSEGSASAIVWNPWIKKAKTMADMEQDAHKTMLCIETANALEDARTVAPNEEHTLKVYLSESI